jgi:hypothetical protein
LIPLLQLKPMKMKEKMKVRMKMTTTMSEASRRPLQHLFGT